MSIHRGVLYVFFVVLLGGLFFALFPRVIYYHYYDKPIEVRKFWALQSVDTMKYSRDLSREKLNDKKFQEVIDRQMRNIAETGATHVAIGTPYDDEFLPILKRWVGAARQNGLHVWFRGNWSGWEGWFDYPSLSRKEHLAKTSAFITKHTELFEDGDIFTSCPECENGGPGDPRSNGDAAGHREFLIAEYRAAQTAFQKIGKEVTANYFSMNGDVARLVMDRETTTALGGIVAIDHYVKTPEQLVRDIQDIQKQSGGRVVLSEFGAPIPDIHGDLSDAQQAAWLKKALELLADTEGLPGMNYWVNIGGSAALWNDNGRKRSAADTLTAFYSPPLLEGAVLDESRKPIPYATVRTEKRFAVADEAGRFTLAFLPGIEKKATVSRQGYIETTFSIPGDKKNFEVTLVQAVKKDAWSPLIDFFSR